MLIELILEGNEGNFHVKQNVNKKKSKEYVEWFGIFKCEVLIVVKKTCLSVLKFVADKPFRLIPLRACAPNAVISATNHFSYPQDLFTKTSIPDSF